MNDIKPGVASRDGMVWLPGGTFRMGSDWHYPEEAPSRAVSVGPFWMDKTPVTNAQFARFVEATAHVTLAEQAPNAGDYPGILPDMVRPGSLVFTPPDGPVSLDDPLRWWRLCFGADWRHPAGPASDLDGLEGHPVVHIALADAEAYAAWAGKALPTEAEWEYAARGGLDGAAYAWGDDLAPQGRRLANYWEGRFPWEGPRPERGVRTTSVGDFPANGFGLFDMIGNVWEWTADWYGFPSSGSDKPCCVPRDPRGGAEADSFDPCTPEIRIGRRVLKGGSHLCAPSYCQRYRPAARYAQPIDTSTSHVGFRCIARP